jgi:hypothetical protein
MVGVELGAQVLGVMIVHQHEGFADPQRGVGRKDRRVLVRLAQPAHVKFGVGHEIFANPWFLQLTLCKL